jgi:Holliday junction resolvasome RuvABC endonuclease subunit
MKILPRQIFTLDLGTKTGWAVYSKDGSIASGTVSFKNQRFEGGGMPFLRFKQWLTELKNASGGFDAVYFEEVRRHLGTDAAHKYGGFLGQLTAWCEHHRIPYQGVPVGTIKRHITGRGNALKEEVIAAIKAKGFNPQDDNEADSLALLDLVLTNYKKEVNL